MIEFGYLPEPGRDGGVSPPAFVALLGRSRSNPRLQGIRIAERVVWSWVFAGNLMLLKVILRHYFAPGSLGALVQAKVLDQPMDDDTLEP